MLLGAGTGLFAIVDIPVRATEYMLDNTRPTHDAVAVAVCSLEPRCLHCPARPKLI